MQSRNELLYKLETSINKLRKFCCPDFDEINSKEYYKEIIEKMTFSHLCIDRWSL